MIYIFFSVHHLFCVSATSQTLLAVTVSTTFTLNTRSVPASGMLRMTSQWQMKFPMFYFKVDEEKKTKKNSLLPEISQINVRLHKDVA